MDVTKTTLTVLFILSLVAGCFWILRPFLTGIIWALIIVVATWPLLLALESRLHGRRWAAVALMTLALLMVFIIPFSLAVLEIVSRGDEIVSWFGSLSAFTIPPPPEWLQKIPFAGPRLMARWQEFSVLHADELSSRLSPYAGSVVSWFVARAGSVGVMLLNFFLTVMIAPIIYAHGEKASYSVCRLASRLGGPRGEEAVLLAARAVRGVALGVVVTALVQSVLGGAGLLITGVPAALLLSGVMFILCVAQIGPSLVLIPAIIWLFWTGETLWGTVLILWTIPVTILDNFLRPALIRKGANLPLVLIFAGVIGGLVAFGVVGLFIGPVILAVAFTLIQAWIGEEQGRDMPGSQASE
ncbi:MAG: AI-2E family transporter YdiK [Geobacter sp.]|nr:MAG: AI-2E family transporter YdiK [Geobacter sp.]